MLFLLPEVKCKKVLELGEGEKCNGKRSRKIFVLWPDLALAVSEDCIGIYCRYTSFTYT